jgi:hypothetical protein
MPTFVVYCRCYSAFRIPAGESVRRGAGDRVLPWIDVRSRYLPPPAQHVARDLLIELRLSAETLEDASNSGLQGAHSQLLSLTVAANAFADDPALECAYRVDAGVAEREWAQSYSPPRHPIPPNSRALDAEPATALAAAADRHPEARRFGRVLAFYRESLRHARVGSSLLAVEYLHIAAETLTPILHARLERMLGVEETELARRLEVSSKAQNPGKALLSAIRLREIYRGDKQLARSVEHTSNGFEHGFADLSDARDQARTVHTRAAEHIRAAIIEASGLPRKHRERLNGAGYAVPMPLFANEYVHVGMLRDVDERVLAPGTPPLKGLRAWKMKVDRSKTQPDGGLLVTTSSDAKGPADGVSVNLGALVQSMPVGLPAGARVPQHRLRSIEIRPVRKPRDGPRGQQS